MGPMKGVRVLAAEEDMGRALLDSLDARQYLETVINVEAPADVVTGALRKAAILEDKGIAYESLNTTQQGLLLALIQEHATVQMTDIAKARLAKIRKEGLKHIKFAWMGSRERGKGHYYRIQGSSFLIEYDNTQNNANHVHSVWRDFKGDFGADLLEEHYKDHSHQ